MTEQNTELKNAEIIPEGGEPIRVKFNPTQYKMDKSISYSEEQTQGYTSPTIQFNSGDPETLSMELFFDSYEEENRDVRESTEKVRDLLEIDGTTHKPPICQFVWGTLDFRCFLESANTTYTLFLEDGIPVRARMEVTFKQYRPLDRQRDEVRRSSPDKSKLHLVSEDDTLWLLADAEYGDPTRWRPIAEENDLANPRRLRPRDLLTVPTLEP